MKADDIARIYMPQSNKEGASLEGVPLRSLTKAEFDALEEYMQRSVDACGFYRKPATKKKEAEE